MTYKVPNAVQVAIQDAAKAVLIRYRESGLTATREYDWKARGERESLKLDPAQREAYVTTYEIAAGYAVEGLVELN